jgi:uncharacterized C2H2 Zn-finger protein
MNDPTKRVLNVLLLTDTDHYVAITNLDRFLNSNSHYSHSMYHCPRCVKPFKNSKKRSEHICSSFVQASEMPKEKAYKFQNWQKSEESEFVIYADIECLLCPSETEKVLQIHKPIAVAYLIISKEESHYREFKGENCMENFLQSLEETTQNICEWMEKNCREPIQMSNTEEKLWNSATNCYLCQKTFLTSENKCRDHDHRNGSYRGAACNDCNRRRQLNRRKVTVVMHNFKNYDVHHVVREGLQAVKHWSVSIIPLTFEKYLTLQARFPMKSNPSQLCLLSFIDSYQFLNSSLAHLIDMCPTKTNTNKVVPPHMEDGKGVFPYSYLTSASVLLENQLPPKDAFFDTLSQSHISDDDYSRAQEAWRVFGCRTLEDYMLAYLKMDVHQLADVFENFRKLSLEEDGLDPIHYFSTPGLSWDAAFKHCNTTIDLLLEEEQYNFFERGRRGGISFVNKHYVKRNSPDDCDAYDPKIPQVEMLYVDANNLYGHALSMPLPKSDFQWEIEAEKTWQQVQQSTTPWYDDTRGYVFEVDILIPEHLHEEFDDLPLAPEKAHPKAEEFSPYMIELWGKEKQYHSSEKLLLTHHPKTRYIVHYGLLLYYVKLGAVVSRVHRCISFLQSPIFEKYISFNSCKRANASTEFQKDFYKLKNNALYGKTVEDVRGRCDIRLCNSEEKMLRYSSKATFYGARRFSPNIVGVHMMRESVLLNKPVAIGQAVLDISKLEMYQLRYDHLKRYSNQFKGSIQVVAGDTDSFFLEVRGISLTQQLLPAMVTDELLDTSNYPKEHALYSTQFKAKLGFIKDESAAKQWQEWIFLRPKCYSLLAVDGNNHKRAKGIQRSVVTRKIKHEDYLKIWKGEDDKTVEVRRFQTYSHQVKTIRERKRALSLWEDKRVWVAPNNSVAYGHHLLSSLAPVKRTRLSISMDTM